LSLYNHNFHLVNYSPWPLLGSLGSIIIFSRIIKLFHYKNYNLLIIRFIITILIIIQWWRDISRESTFQGYHTSQVIIGIKWGIILFITSEILFFVSFFWTFFHSRLTPTIELGLTWPPTGIKIFDPFKIPLLNTIILLTSGISVTWAHHRLINNKFNQTIQRLLITVILGIYFTFLQGLEYYSASFNIADSVYGSIFFLATGFHGLHVLIGTIFLLVCLIRHYKSHFSSNHHFGFEAAAWYWHFVDIVWLFLYLSIYWWGK
jgi:cytochrome c oxidase subunit 3